MVVPETVKTLGDRAFADNVWEARTYYFQTKTPPACEGNPFDGIIFDKSTSRQTNYKRCQLNLLD